MIRLDKEKLESIQTVMMMDTDGVNVRLSNLDLDDMGWYITDNEEIFEEGVKINEDEDREYFNKISKETFLDKVKDKDLILYVVVKKGDDWENQKFEDWEHLTMFLGINKLVVVSVKIPEIIAKRFEYFSTQSGTKSQKLRELIYEYIKKEWIEQADNLILRSNI